MRLQEWDGTVQTIIAECGHEQKKTDRILMAWRAKLGKEPTFLHPFQIDEIIREARGRLSKILQRQELKQTLADEIIGAEEGGFKDLGKTELLSLFRLDEGQRK